MPALDTRKIKVRGTKYTIRELTAGEYDDCVRAATNAEDEVDTVLLAKLMALKCVEPPMTDVEQSGLPFRVWRAINRAINELHYVAEETDEGNASDPKNDSTGS